MYSFLFKWKEVNRIVEENLGIYLLITRQIINIRADNGAKAVLIFEKHSFLLFVKKRYQ